jgi:acyl-CoA synthetase (AMP-forming)/AMP-acid ligase II
LVLIAETSPVSFQSTPSDPILKRVETVGKVRPHVTAKVVDPEGNTLDVGNPGEVLVAGYLVQKGSVCSLPISIRPECWKLDIGMMLSRQTA